MVPQPEPRQHFPWHRDHPYAQTSIMHFASAREGICPGHAIHGSILDVGIGIKPSSGTVGLMALRGQALWVDRNV
jgi:hypothetical protein